NPAPAINLLCLCHNRGERLRVADCDICEHLAVEFDICLLHGRHQLAVSRAVQASRSVDAGDPQLAQIALAHAAITAGVPQALEHRFVRSSEQQMLRAALTFRDLQNFLMTAVPLGSSFYAHVLLPPANSRASVGYTSCAHP